MSLRDYSYYEANAADVKLDEIISTNKPEEDVFFSKQTLQRLREDNLDKITFRKVTVGRRYGDDSYFAFSEGDDLGWLGYFIGRSKSLRELIIERWSEDVIHALSDGIARNRSIQTVTVRKLSSDVFAAVARTLMNLTQLEELNVSNYFDYDVMRDPLNPLRPLNDCVALGNLLESGVRLKCFSLEDYHIGDAGVTFLGRGLRSIGSSLKRLHLCDCIIGNEGLSTLAVALDNCVSIKKLRLDNNDFSMAAGGLRSLSVSLQRARIQLDELRLWGCRINDEGLQALIEGIIDHCKPLDHLSSLQLLDLSCNNFGNEGLSTLAVALANCTSLKKLYLDYNDFSMAAGGLRSLSVSLQRTRIQLDELRLWGCRINDEGLQAFVEGESLDHLSNYNYLIWERITLGMMDCLLWR